MSPDPRNSRHRALDILRLVDLEPDLFGLGLRGTLASRSANDSSPAASWKRDGCCANGCRIVAYAGLVEIFDRDLYNHNMSVGRKPAVRLASWATPSISRD